MNSMNVPLNFHSNNDSQAGKVEDLFSLPKIQFFHDKIVMTMGLSVMSIPATLFFVLLT